VPAQYSLRAGLATIQPESTARSRSLSAYLARSGVAMTCTIVPCRWPLLAVFLMAVLFLPPAAAARARCGHEQIYRPSLGICQSKSSKSARPYVKRARTVVQIVRERVIVREVIREMSSEPLSTIPLPEPKGQGSLNPLPRWKTTL